MLRAWRDEDLAPFAALNADPAVMEYLAPFTPGVEIGWRIAREHWGRGYAPEAARAA